MNKSKGLVKLEDDLSHFLISEACRKDPSKRGSSEMYKYKGLSISINDKEKDVDKLFSVQIGSLEAQFKIENGDKVSGGLVPDDEILVHIWASQSDVTSQLRMLFIKDEDEDIRAAAITPFDLEDI